MPTSRLTSACESGGLAMSSTLTSTADGQIGHELTLPAAKTGTLSTRTNDTTGTLTMEASHGIVTADIIDLYWDGGRRYNVVVGAVSGTSVPISGGAGDVLPAQDTAVTAQVQQVIDSDFDADLIVSIGALCPKQRHVCFSESGDVLALALDIGAAALWFWLNSGTATNPLEGKTIDDIRVTQASSAATADMKIGILYDSSV